MKQRFNNPIPTPPGTQAISRAVAVLRTLALARNGLGVSELAAEMKVNKAAVFRILGALEAEGLVARDSADAYRLGPGLIALGSAALGAADLGSATHDELVALVEQTGETATFEILAGRDVLIIAEVQGRFLLGTAPELGTRWPAYATSTGKVLLAFTNPTAPLRTLAKRASRTIVSHNVLERELQQVRRNGYATASDELEVGFTAIAAPVRNHLGAVVGAISINGPTARLTKQRLKDLVGAVRDSADRASRRLGATPAMLTQTAGGETPPKRSARRAASGSR